MTPQSIVTVENVRLLGVKITNNMIDGLITIELPIDTLSITYYVIFWGDRAGNKLPDLPPIVASRAGYIGSYALNNLHIPPKAKCFLVYMLATNTLNIDFDHFEFDSSLQNIPYILDIPLK